jgi:hypothetical protein
VVDCAGRPEASVALGAIENIVPGPKFVDDKQTYEVRFTSGTGTGYEAKEVALVDYRHRTINVLWRHLAVEMVSGWGGEAHEDHFQWEYVIGANRILVSGYRQPIYIDTGGATAAKKSLPRESYCWQQTTRDFEKCPG